MNISFAICSGRVASETADGEAMVSVKVFPAFSPCSLDSSEEDNEGLLGVRPLVGV